MNFTTFVLIVLGLIRRDDVKLTVFYGVCLVWSICWILHQENIFQRGIRQWTFDINYCQYGLTIVTIVTGNSNYWKSKINLFLMITNIEDWKMNKSTVMLQNSMQNPCGICCFCISNFTLCIFISYHKVD